MMTSELLTPDGRTIEAEVTFVQFFTVKQKTNNQI
jgi:hypothetical protein